MLRRVGWPGVVVAGLGCGRAQAPPAAGPGAAVAPGEPGCEQAVALRAKATGLEVEGRIERALRARRKALARCPAQPDPSIEALQAALAEAADPDSLLAQARAALERGERPAAQRLLDRAVAALERAHGARLEVEPLLPPEDHPEIAMTPLRWSTQGTTLMLQGTKQVYLFGGPPWRQLRARPRLGIEEVISLSPRGEFLLVQKENHLFVERVSDGKVVAECALDPTSIGSSIVSPDDGLLACGASAPPRLQTPDDEGPPEPSSEVRLIDLRKGTAARTLALPRGNRATLASYAFEFSPDGAYLLSLWSDMKGRIWSVATGQLKASAPMGNTYSGPRFHWSADGKRVAWASGNEGAVWSTERPGALVRFEHPNCPIDAMVFDARGRTVFTAYTPRELCAFSATTGAVQCAPAQPVRHREVENPLGALWFSADQRLLLGMHARGHGIMILDPATGKDPSEPWLGDHHGRLSGEFLAPGRPADRRYFVSKATEPLALCEVGGKDRVGCRPIRKPPTGARLDPAAPFAVVRDDDEVVVVDPLTGQAIHRLGQGEVDAMEASPDGSTAALVRDTKIMLYDPASGRELLSFDMGLGVPRADALSFSRRGALVLSSRSPTARQPLLWRLGEATSIERATTPVTVSQVRETARGELVGLTERDSKVAVVSLPSGRPTAVLQDTSVRGLALSPWGSAIVRPGKSPSLLDPATGEERSLAAPSGNEIAWGADEAFFALLDQSDEVHVVRHGSGDTPVKQGYKGQKSAAALSAGGKWLAFVDDKELKLLGVTTGEQRVMATGQEDIEAMAFAAQGPVLAVARYRTSRVDLIDTSVGGMLGWLQPLGGARGLVVASSGHVEFVGPAAEAGAHLRCRVGKKALPLEACADRLFVRGLAARLVAADLSFAEP